MAQILDAEADNSDVPSPVTLSLNQAASPAQADRVIQTYRGIVNLMAGLLLRLDQEGKSDALLQEMRTATRQSVRPVLHHAYMLHRCYCFGRALLCPVRWITHSHDCVSQLA